MTKFTVDSVAEIVLYYPCLHGKEGSSKEVL